MYLFLSEIACNQAAHTFLRAVFCASHNLQEVKGYYNVEGHDDKEELSKDMIMDLI